MQKNCWDETPGAAPIRYTASGAVDTEHYLQAAHRLRAEFIGIALRRLGRFLLKAAFSLSFPRKRESKNFYTDDKSANAGFPLPRE